MLVGTTGTQQQLGSHPPQGDAVGTSPQRTWHPLPSTVHLLAKVPSQTLRPLRALQRAGSQAPSILSPHSPACHTYQRAAGPMGCVQEEAGRVGAGRAPESCSSELAAICS